MNDKDNPGVWSDLPEDAVSVCLFYMRKGAEGVFPGPEYTRKPPKTKAREIAERVKAETRLGWALDLADIVERAILEYEKVKNNP